MIWVVAQVHLMFGAFVLGVPIFASIVEVIGWRTRDPATDVTFEAGRLIPFAIQAWDGANGEKGLMMSLSWSFVVLEAAPPARAYVLPFVGIGLVGLAEWWLVRRVRGGRRTREPQ